MRIRFMRLILEFNCGEREREKLLNCSSKKHIEKLKSNGLFDNTGTLR